MDLKIGMTQAEDNRETRITYEQSLKMYQII
jgi:hypothetical protein